MIYYIFPPVIIVIGLGIIVFFIFRRSEEIQKEIKKSEELELEGSGKIIISKIHVFSLAFLEKLMLRIKLLFLKSYNKFDHWVHSVRNKKEQKQEHIESAEEAREEAEAASLVPEIAKEKQFFVEKPAPKKIVESKAKVIPVVQPRIPESLRRMSLPRTEEIKVKPMVSKRVVNPEVKKKQRSQLEEALIERIALNPRDIEAYERLGDYYVEQQNNEDALECFRQVLKLSPGNHKARLRVQKLEKIILGW